MALAKEFVNTHQKTAFASLLAYYGCILPNLGEKERHYAPKLHASAKNGGNPLVVKYKPQIIFIRDINLACRASHS